MRKNKDKIGIYLIYNHTNDKVYIGQSWNIMRRLKEHKQYCSNIHLKRAFEKNGLDKFSFCIIRELHDTNITQILLDSLEQKYINEYHSLNPSLGYNMKEGGSHGKHNIESKEKNRQSKLGKKLTDEVKNKISIGCKGHKPPSKKSLMGGVQKRRENGSYIISEKTRQKMRQSHLGKKQKRESILKMLEWRKHNYKISSETIEKIRLSNIGKHHVKNTAKKISKSMKGKPWTAKRIEAQINRNKLTCKI